MDEPDDAQQPASAEGEAAADWNAVDRHSIKAVVLDANTFSGGEFSRPMLEGWAREARAASIEIWLPEVVVWELASHSSESREAARQVVETARKALRAAGIGPPEFPAMSREEVLRVMTGEIAQVEGVTILECSPEHAKEGLKDQVLGREPAEMKKGVKTGAADGAWLRSALEEAGDIPEETIVVVSNDRLTQARLDEWGLGNPMVVRSWADVREGLFKYKLAATEATARILDFLSNSVENGSWQQKIEFGSVKAGELPLELIDHWGWTELRQLDVEVTTLTLVLGAGQLQVDLQESTATAEVYFQGDVFLTGWMDDPHGGLLPSIENLQDAVIRVPMILALKDGRVQWAKAEETVEALFFIPRYWDDEEAIADILWNLRLVPGVAQLREDWSIFHKELEAGEVQLDLGNGRVAQFFLERSHGDRWRLSVVVGSESLDLECDYDADVVIGGVTMDPPWAVSAEGGDGQYSRTPDWALSAFLIKNLVPGEADGSLD